MIIDVFQRIEKKYLIDEIQYKKLTNYLTNYMVVDKYGNYSISNIYFDTNSFQLVRSSIEKPVYKEKLRLRSYGIPKENDTVFIEVKKKYKGVVYKRREQMTYAKAYDYLYNGIAPEKNSQILSEIDWFLKLYNPKPAAFISYDREAFFGKDNKELRVTFDSNIVSRGIALDLTKGIWGNPLLKAGQRLMEIKIPNAMPLWLASILSELKIYPCSFSKYGNWYKYHYNNKAIAGGSVNVQ